MKVERLFELALYSGTPQDAAMPLALAMQLASPREMQNNARWRRAYLGRYLRFPPSEVDRMWRSEANAYIKLATELLKTEAGKVATTFENL